ncbi:MAG: serine hydrolase [Dehalococcoidia bacterium]
MKLAAGALFAMALALGICPGGLVEARWLDMPLIETTPTPPACVTASPIPPPATSASSFAVYDPAAGRFLWEHNAGARRFPSSLTKIATAIVALESRVDLGGEVTVDVDYRTHSRSSDLGLRPGMRTTLGDLFAGMLVSSGNDAAKELAAEVAGSETTFVERMNELVDRLGLQDTGFANAHGRDREGQYSTAHDLALLAAEAMGHPEFRAAVAQTSATIAVDGEPWRLASTNRFLSSYGGATGIKTGFTVLGGPSLAASAYREGRELIVVLLNDPDRFADAGRLLDWAFANHDWDC